MEIHTDPGFEEALKKLRESPEYHIERAKLDITESLCIAMQEAGISRADLAAHLGTSRAYVTKLLQGNVNFTIETLVKISQATGIQLTSPQFKHNVSNMKSETFDPPDYGTPNAPAQWFPGESLKKA